MNEVGIAISGISPPEWIGRCESFVRSYLEKRGIDDWEVSILLCNDRVIRDLNLRYRGLDRATDVLSFSQLEGPGGKPASGSAGQAAGDVIISLETLNRTAERSCINTEEEFKRLLIHGMLHLEGIEHNEEGSRSEMLTIQEQMLKELIKERIF